MPRKEFKVYQFDLNGNLIAEYNSISSAAARNHVTERSIDRAVYGFTKYNVSHNFIWLRETMKDTIGEIVEARRNEIRERKRIYDELARKNKPTRIERRGEYIFIEKNLSAENRCLRCSLYNSSHDCFPCNIDERKDGKQGYWRRCKHVEI